MLLMRSRLPLSKDIGEANHSDIGPCSGRAVLSKPTRSPDGINSPFHAKDSTISVNFAHLNLQALLDTGAAVTAESARVWQNCVNLDPPNHVSLITDGPLEK